MALYMIANGPAQTTAAFAPVTTGTAIKTMLQVQCSATAVMEIVEWGISLDGFAAALPGRVELIETDVAATVTAHVTAGITKLDGSALSGGDPVTNRILVGTGATGYTATAEGTTTASRNLDGPQFIAPTTQFIRQFPLGERPILRTTGFLRIRVTFGTAVNAYCWVKVNI